MRNVTLYTTKGILRWECCLLELFELVWAFYVRALGSNKAKAWGLGGVLNCCTVFNVQWDTLEELLRAGYPVDTTHKLWIIWETELSRQTSFDINPVFHVICGYCPFWDMQLEGISLPFKSLKVADSDDKTCLCKGLKPCRCSTQGKISVHISM